MIHGGGDGWTDREYREVVVNGITSGSLNKVRYGIYVELKVLCEV